MTMPELRAELNEWERWRVQQQRRQHSRGSSRQQKSRERQRSRGRVADDDGGSAAPHPLRRRQQLLRRVAEYRAEAMVTELGLGGHVRPWTKIVRDGKTAGNGAPPDPAEGARARSRQSRRGSRHSAVKRLAAVREEIEVRLADAERAAAQDVATRFESLGALRDAVRQAGGDVTTPGLHGDARRHELAVRLCRLRGA